MKISKVISAILAASMLSGYTFTAYAAEKEEVVYVMTDADGSVDSVYVVNSFDGGNITDYGEYSNVKLLNSDGNITSSGDEITFSAPENQKVYYQGTLDGAEIPWVISIRYFLDGEELSAEEIAGKSGSLKISVDITENEKCGGSFYDNYALQCSFTLDTDICRNISADGATTANVGSKKQITFTALAGCGLSRSITADVTDFEMSAAQINGVRMNLGVDIDYNGNVTDLIDGAEKLDDGAKELYDGTVELDDGVSELNSGIEKLRGGIDTAQEGLSELNEKSADLTDGSAQVKKALTSIQSSLSSVSANADSLEQLTEASAQIKAGIDSLCGGISQLKNSLTFDGYKAAFAENGLDVDALRAGNEQAVQQLTAQLNEIKTALAQMPAVAQLAEQKAQLTAQAEQLETIIGLLSGSNALIDGTEAYFGKTSEAAAQLEAGAQELKAKYAEFDAAIGELAKNLSEMLVNMSKLSDGINTLVSEYEKLDGGIGEYTDGVGKLYDGFSEISDGARELAEGGIALSDGTGELVSGASELSDGTGELREKAAMIDSTSADELNDVLDSLKNSYTPVSFVSEKNSDVSLVQFVINTKAIEIPEPEPAPEEAEEELNFWQKLLKLFGL